MNASDLVALVQQGESATLEFKATTGQRSDACKSLSAMLNGDGGRVLFGVAPGGSIDGQDVAEKTRRDLAEELARIEPTVVPAVEEIELETGKTVISVLVPRGQQRPYKFRGKACKRLANTTREMTPLEVEQALLERLHGVSRWENQPAEGWSIADLDADEITRTLREAVVRGRLEDPSVSDPREILRGLGLVGRDGRILRAAVVLFARREQLLPDYPQCQLRLARFRGADRSEFLDSKQLHGNAFDLLKAAQRFLVENLPVAGRVKAGLFEREDDPLFPPEALREALANAFCHRDYAPGGGAVSVAVFDDRVEIASSGSLHFGLTVDALLRPHESLPWNPLIARVFYLRGVVEQWGRGIQKMFELTALAGLPAPEIEASVGSVMIRFRAGQYVAPTRVPHDLTARQRAILEVLAGGERLLPSEIHAALARSIDGEVDSSLDFRRTREALVELRSMGLVGQRGRGRGSRWFLARRLKSR